MATKLNLKYLLKWCIRRLSNVIEKCPYLSLFENVLRQSMPKVIKVGVYRPNLSIHRCVFAHFSVFYNVEPTFKNWENTHKNQISSVALHFCISDDSVSTFPPQLELHSEVAPVQGLPAMQLAHMFTYPNLLLLPVPSSVWPQGDNGLMSTIWSKTFKVCMHV